MNGARFYGLPVSTTRITLEKRPWSVPEQLGEGGNAVVPFAAGEELAWKLVQS